MTYPSVWTQSGIALSFLLAEILHNLQSTSISKHFILCTENLDYYKAYMIIPLLSTYDFPTGLSSTEKSLTEQLSLPQPSHLTSNRSTD